MKWRFFKTRRFADLEPDEIFLDTTNLPSFDRQQFEGQIEKPISRTTLGVVTTTFAILLLLLFSRIGYLTMVRGEALAARSESNSLRHTPIFAERGIIYDRNGVELAWNTPTRIYSATPGLAHVVGFVGYPDENQAAGGRYEPKELVGRGGAEKVYNDWLAGKKGIKIEETDVAGQIVSDYLLTPPISGQGLTLSIDVRIQEKLFALIKNLAIEKDFLAGAGVLLDVETGELLALVSYPEYDLNRVTVGKDGAAISGYLTDPKSPFLNRALAGLYTPGSIIKPFIALAALNEKIIAPEKILISTGALTVANPYDPKKPSIFKDWKAHGPVDMRRAIAVSSNVYFYIVGGGFGNQSGLGINLIDHYARIFGLGAPTGLSFDQEAAGVIPAPDWKKENFNGEDWRLGDTYHTAIGQYGFLVTPIQMVRAVAVIANGGQLVTPTIKNQEFFTQPTKIKLGFRPADLEVVKEGMRQSVTAGTAQGLSVPYVKMAAKTGTAELGTTKERVNAWIIGFFPYETPRYAFAVVMEKGHRENIIGGVFIVRQLIDWLNLTAPEYFKPRVASP